MTPRRLIRSMTVGLVIVAVGCGNAGETMTTQDWVTAADAVCADMNAQLEPIPEPQSIDEMADASAQVDEISRTGLAELRALGLPDGNAAAVLDAFDELIDVSAQWSGAFIEAGSMADMTPELETLFGELESAHTNAVILAEDIGLQQCFTNQLA
jgi:hypothetical protein